MAKKPLFNGHAHIELEKIASVIAIDSIVKKELTVLEQITNKFKRWAIALAEENTEDCFVNTAKTLKEKVINAKIAYNLKPPDIGE